MLSGDGIVVATGAAPRRLPGTEALGPADGLFVLRTLDDSLALRAAVSGSEGTRVVVIGAGFIGSEVASTCTGLGCRVTVVEVMDIPLSNVLGPVVGGHCATLHAAHGVELRTGVGIEHVERGVEGARLAVRLAGGEVLDADVVVMGIGVVPSTAWLEGSGLTIDNGVVCDEALFAADGIVAAGDLARWRWRHDVWDELVRIEHWEVAANAGAAAARSLLAGRADATPFTPIPYFWSDQYGIRIQVLGNPAGYDAVEIALGSLDDGKFLAVYGRDDRLRGVMAIGMPRQLMGFRMLLQNGASWDEALAHARA